MLKKRIALITGAAGGGIGTSIARRLADQGVHVILNGRRAASLVKIADDIRAANGTVSIAAGDCADPNFAGAMVKQVVDTHGGIDILVNNAARGGSASLIEDLTFEEWEAELHGTLYPGYVCTRAATPFIKRSSAGRIVFISSSAAWRGTWGRSAAYAAAKSGIHGLTVQLALELAAYDVTVNAIAPTQILTPRVVSDGRRTITSINQHASECVPLGRVGLPEDVSSIVCFLTSIEAAYLTGQIIHLDGGSALAPKTTKLA